VHFSIIKFIAIAVLAAFFAASAFFRRFLWTGEDASDDGPRAVIAEFIGLWVGGFFLFWSFTVDIKHMQWSLRAVAVAAAVAGAAFSVYFAGQTEVPEDSSKEPTGFKNDTTDLHLE
jgi:hypothetical protein